MAKHTQTKKIVLSFQIQNFCDEKRREIDEVERKRLKVDRMTEDVMEKVTENARTLEMLNEQIERANELVGKIESM